MATIQSTIQVNDKFSKAIHSLSNGLNIIISNLEKVASQSKNAFDTSSLKTAREEIAKSTVLFDELGKKVSNTKEKINKNTKAQNELNDAAKNHKKHIDNANRSLFGMWGNVRRIATTWLSFQSVKTLVNAADNYINSTARLNLMNDGLQTTKELQDKIYQSAQRTYSSYTNTANAVAKLGILAGKAFKNNDEIIQFTELVQKQFAVSGASTQEKNAAMYQLTQAMASNALKGDEFRSILENAPLIAKTLSEALGVGEERLKDMASEGQITAEVIKNAMFGAAKNINEQFKNMPLTFGAIWTQAINKITMALRPLYERMQKLWNSEKFKNFVNGLVDGFLVLMAVGGQVFEYLIKVAEILYDNWSLIKPVILGVVAAMSLLWLQTLKNIAASLIHVFVSALQTLYLTYLYWKSHGLTFALKQLALAQTLCASTALFWMFIIIAIIVIFYLVIAVINKLCDTSISATGIIAGVFAWLGATLYNIFAGAFNAILDMLDFFVSPFFSVADWIYTAFHGGFTDWIGAVKNIFGKFIAWVIGAIKPILSIWDAITGTDLSGKLSATQENLRNWGKKEDYVEKHSSLEKTFSLKNNLGWKRTSATDWYDKGYKWGEKLEDKISSKFDVSKYGEIGENASTYDQIMNGINNSVGVGKQPDVNFGGSPNTDDLLKQIRDNTAGTNDQLMRNNADMSYLRNLAERKAINNISNIKLDLSMTNNNNVNSEMDLDDIADYLGKKVFNTISTSAAGVYA